MTTPLWPEMVAPVLFETVPPCARSTAKVDPVIRPELVTVPATPEMKTPATGPAIDAPAAFATLPPA